MVQTDHETKHIVILQGHPDPAGEHLCHALADAYAGGAIAAGYAVTTVTPATLDFPMLRTQKDWIEGETPDGLKEVQKHILDADHLLKGSFEQIFRPALAAATPGTDATFGEFHKLMKGTSCRVVITMGMPAAAYKYFFFAHSLKNLERNILKFIGIKPIRSSLFGMVESASADKRKRWLDEMRKLGERGG
jgi:putative NADPH-quinone reductase